MTPDAIRTISHLRQSFYTLFASAMGVPVKITNRNSQTGNSSIASWVDSQQRLNYMYIFAHTAPDDLVPERPLTLRIRVNKGGDTIALTRQKRADQELNHSWHLELILLPDEILDFLPWVVSMVGLYDRGSVAVVPPPPHPLDSSPSSKLLFHSTQTQKASTQLSQKLFSSKGIRIL
ncbi:MAG TPA: hypothetical protein V6C65_17165 [Allocoleopsis sp.]